MRQVPHEHPHPFLHPRRMLHVRKPGGTHFSRGGPEFIRPGLLGVAPGMHILRPPPRHVHYPLPVCPPPDMMIRQQEHVRPPPEPVPLYPPLVAENFFQMAWLKGIQREKKMSFTHNHDARKYSNVGRLKNGSIKVAKKGVSLGNKQTKLCSKELQSVDAKHKEEHAESSKKTEVALEDQSGAEKESKDQHAGTRSSNEKLSLETVHMAEQMDEKTAMEDLEEGEIGAGSPEQHVNFDVSEDSEQTESASAASGEGDENCSNFAGESVDSTDSETGSGSSGQIEILIVVSEEDPQQVEKKKATAHTPEKEFVNPVSDSVNIIDLQILGIPIVDTNDTILNSSSAELLVQNVTNITTQDLRAMHDCQAADVDRDDNCLDNEISPPVRELSSSTKPESVVSKGPKADAESSIDAFAKPEEERSGNVMEINTSSSSMACKALVGVCSDSNLQIPIETCSNEHRETPVQTHETSSTMESGPMTQEESAASLTTEQILATLRCILSESPCLALAEKVSDGVIDAGNVMQGLLPFLSEFSGILGSFEKGNNCSKSRDPRGSLKALCLEELESCSQQLTPAEESSIGKRKHEKQEDVLETSAKRLRTEGEVACHLKLNNQLSPEVLHQEPVDMEIDSAESIAYTFVETGLEATLAIFNNTEKDTKHSGSEHSLALDPVKPRLRPRDPRRALVDRGKAQIDNMCAWETLSQSEALPRALDSKSALLRSLNPLSLRLYEGVGSLEDIHTEGLTDQQLQAVYTERARRIDEQSCMLYSKKLCLVLDLDHTLLNSAKFSEVDKFKTVLHEMEAADRRSIDNRSVRRDLYCYPKLGMWTKLRPGVWDFLSRASELYELHVYTMGNKAYATEMAKLLDPTGTLFAGRVISRGDDSNRTFNSDALPKSKDLDGVLGLESAVIIIDDSVQVWPHHRHNLLLVERYMYFPSSRRQFGLFGPSLLEIKHDERASDGMLASVLKMIEKVHHNFFANERLHEVDVRRILAAEKRSILAGCKIVFSRVYPQGESQPHLHPLWKTAEQFGAVCTTTIDDGVSHVVAISRGTDKVKWAIRTGRFSVCPAWLEASAVLYRRANESDFPVPL